MVVVVSTESGSPFVLRALPALPKTYCFRSLIKLNLQFGPFIIAHVWVLSFSPFAVCRSLVFPALFPGRVCAVSCNVFNLRHYIYNNIFDTVSIICVELNNRSCDVSQREDKLERIFFILLHTPKSRRINFEDSSQRNSKFKRKALNNDAITQKVIQARK